MLHARFVLANLGHVHTRALAHPRRRFARNHAGFGQRLRRRQFDFKPLLKAIFVLPNAPHLCARITRDQLALLSNGPAICDRILRLQRENSLFHDIGICRREEIAIRFRGVDAGRWNFRGADHFRKPDVSRGRERRGLEVVLGREQAPGVGEPYDSAASALHRSDGTVR